MGLCVCKVERWEKSAREKLTRGDHPRAQGRLGMDQTLWAIFDRNCGVEEEKDWDLVKGLQVVKE